MYRHSIWIDRRRRRYKKKKRWTQPSAELLHNFESVCDLVWRWIVFEIEKKKTKPKPAYRFSVKYMNIAVLYNLWESGFEKKKNSKSESNSKCVLSFSFALVVTICKVVKSKRIKRRTDSYLMAYQRGKRAIEIGMHSITTIDTCTTVRVPSYQNNTECIQKTKRIIIKQKKRYRQLSLTTTNYKLEFTFFKVYFWSCVVLYLFVIVNVRVNNCDSINNKSV